jgi:hypothetical protein
MEKKLLNEVRKTKLSDYPELLLEFDSESNIGVDPINISSGSHKQFWWKCTKINCESNCQHIWKTEIRARTQRKYGCPWCSGRQVCKHNSFGYKYPEIMKTMIDISKNQLDLYTISPKGNRMIILTCSKSHCECNCKCDWKCCVYDITRTDGKSTGCPMCGGRIVCKHKSIKYTHTYIMKYWDYDVNTIDPETISFGSAIKIHLKCLKFTCKNKCVHRWSIKPNKITSSPYELKCPFCNKQKICEHNSLQARYSELMNEWASDNEYNPNELHPYSQKRALWICSKCMHKWDCQIISRTRCKSDCPRCHNHSKSKVSLEWLTYKEIVDNTVIKTYNDKEFCIPNTKYKADGYSNELNKIYEFHGDLYHGHLKYPREKEIFGKSMQERYNNTVKKRDKIISLNYKYEEIWEHDWNIIKKKIKIIQRWWRDNYMESFS